MPTLASLVTSKTRTPTATVRLNGRIWPGIISLSRSQSFGSGVSGGTVTGRDPPTTPAIGMSISWRWGYNGVEVDGFTGEVTDILDKSYPDQWVLEVKDPLSRADRVSEDIATSPLNDITARAAIEYILSHYAGLTRLAIPDLEASGSAWAGTHWKLGILTPVSWTNTTALKACQDICSVLGFWLYAGPDGVVRAVQMERKPSSSPLRTFRRGTDLLVQGAPERRQTLDSIRNRVVVKGANTGVEGAQITDTWQTDHPLLPAGVYQTLDFSSFLIEYENASEAGNASATSVAQRLVTLHSRQPNVVRARTKADPRIQVGSTIAIQDSGIRYSSAQSFFVYALERTFDAAKASFDDQLTLDGGVGDTGYTTVPPPIAAFTWKLMTETLDGTPVVEVFLDGSSSSSPSEGEIVTWAWSTTATPYASTPNSGAGETFVFIIPASAGTADITLTVTDTTSKTGSLTQTVTLAGDDLSAPASRTLSAAMGAAWYVTADGGATWRTEVDDAVAVPPIGSGIDPRSAPGSAAAYGLIATKDASGTALRVTLDALASPSTALASLGAAISCLWQNETNPARVWAGVGDTVYRSTDGGATFTAMAKPAAGTNVNWVIEDPVVDNSVFVACGKNLYHATNPVSGWVVLYAGPTGATARQFVRSRDGQVTWVCYTGTFTGSPLQRVETSATVTMTGVSEVRSLALNKDASATAATIYAIDANNPAGIWSADGLTGLSVAASTQTFPAGATVQHMLADPDVDLFYTADFDSVAAGTGAIRKYFSQQDQLLLFKAGAAGEQGTMLGMGAASRPFAYTLLMLPQAESGTADKLFILDGSTGVWTSKALPESGKTWFMVRANPFNPNRLLLYRHETDDVNALWYSNDFGDNWTNVFTDLSNYTLDLAMLAWSGSFANEWVASRNDSGTNAEQVLRGSSTTYAETNVGAFGRVSAAPGRNGDILWMDSAAAPHYLDSSDADHAGATGIVALGCFYTLPGTLQAAWARDTHLGESRIYVTTDYRSGTFAPIDGTDARQFLALLADGTIIGGGRSSQVLEVADAWGASPVVTTPAFFGSTVAEVAADAQTHMTCAAAVIPSGGAAATYPAVRDPSTGTWAAIARPASAGDLVGAIEVVVR